jgi:hypothetical protein
MTARARKNAFASRSGKAENWIKTPEVKPLAPAKGDTFTARLTIDVTPELRGRIKVEAFRRGVTVADMLRDLFVQTFSEAGGERR